MAINYESDISYSVTSDIDDLETIRAWLYRIGEPEEDHHLVIDKCKSDPEAMAYFLLAVNCYAVTVKKKIC
ncbi:MAG: hypothetical protein KIT59_09970 [Nitrosomonas sp.]|nr:hypothetical protein [Nitrosomonas sp.]